VHRALFVAGALLPISAPGLATAEQEPQTQPPAYQAEIRRTEYGIPHVMAEDWSSLGFGYGYAYAQDNFCVAMRAIVFATSRSAEFFGEEEGDVVADFVLRHTFGSKEEFARDHLPEIDSDAYQLTAGFAAGMNRSLRDTGADKLAEGEDGCRDADWVFEVDVTDLAMLNARVALWASSDQDLVRQAIFDASVAVSDEADPAGAAAPMPTPIAGSAEWRRLERDLRQFRDASGVGRNVVIEVLEHFDAKGFTRRAGDTRRVVGEPSATVG